MKRYLFSFFIISLGCVILFSSSSAFGTQLTFSQTVEEPVGSGLFATGTGILDYFLTGTQLKVTVNNISPLTDSGGNSNSPAITGFGFNSGNPTTLLNYEISAYVFISGPDSGPSKDVSSFWDVDLDSNLQGGNGGITFSFAPNTANGVQGGLINPLADGLTGNNLFETTALFLINFENDPGELTNWNMRFQNVGLDGEASLNNVAPVPEPSSILLMSAGLVGFVTFRKKFKKR